MNFDDQLAALQKHCRFSRATIEDNGIRSWEITLAGDRFHCYRLNDFGHEWKGSFPNFLAAWSKTTS
jgi:hypothetical protein